MLPGARPRRPSPRRGGSSACTRATTSGTTCAQKLQVALILRSAVTLTNPYPFKPTLNPIRTL